MDSRTRLLLEAPILPTILRLALPNVIVMAVQTSIGLIETYFVAKLGLDALAGIALVFPLFMLLQMVSAGAMGGGILTAVARARWDRAGKTAPTSWSGARSRSR
jgi:Na+-driven multidrug efflux pump